jgi:hypothetical protein
LQEVRFDPVCCASEHREPAGFPEIAKLSEALALLIEILTHQEKRGISSLFPDKLYTLIGLLLFSVLSILPLLSGFHGLRRAEKCVIRFTERRALAVWVLFFSVIGIRLALLPALRVPVPGIHDEFSYLLMSDTFAHGRLTNPSHPMWVSFETMHVNWIPTYSSMYPPAQGFVLMIGQLLGHPWIGVLLSSAAMCALIVWMLQAWIPPRWAFLGGVLTAIQFGVTSYWINSYWGGAIAAGGGALVLGALGRIRRTARLRDALLLGLGFALLANSRPYEGLVFCIPPAMYFFWWMLGIIKTRDNLRVRTVQVLLPLLASMILLISFMAYYNWRLTGNRLLFPHIVYTNTYYTSPSFLWQKLGPPMHYRNAQFEDYFNGWARNYYHRSGADALRLIKEKFEMFGSYFFAQSEWLLLPFVPFLFRDRKMHLLLTTLLIGALGVFVVIWGHPHYAAPLVCVVFALVVQTMRHLNTIRVKGRHIGALGVRVIVVTLLAVTLDRVVDHHCDVNMNRCGNNFGRAEIAAELGSTPGKHLVMVRYRKNHNHFIEWVHNGAEIDSAKILWARDLDGPQNDRLFAYFKDRQIWLIQPDEIDPTLSQLKLYPRAVAQPMR